LGEPQQKKHWKMPLGILQPPKDLSQGQRTPKQKKKMRCGKISHPKPPVKGTI